MLQGLGVGTDAHHQEHAVFQADQRCVFLLRTHSQAQDAGGGGQAAVGGGHTLGAAQPGVFIHPHQGGAHTLACRGGFGHPVPEFRVQEGTVVHAGDIVPAHFGAALVQHAGKGRCFPGAAVHLGRHAVYRHQHTGTAVHRNAPILSH